VVFSSPSTILLTHEGKQYEINSSTKTIREVGAGSQQQPVTSSPSNLDQAKVLFAKNCVGCHGPGGKGIRAVGTPDFTSQAVQHGLTDEQIRTTIAHGKENGRMPAWSGKLTDVQISELASYIRTFSSETPATQVGTSSTSAPQAEKSTIYEAGDDVLVSLPSGRSTDRHGVYVNFAHRFAFDPAFTGSARGGALLGLDGFALPSFGFRYGVTDKLSVGAYRSPSIIGAPIQLMAGYNILDEHKGAPLNLMVRVSLEGQADFRKNYTENIEAIISRSITHRAQFYLVPTMSFNARRLSQGGYLESQVLDLPGINTFSLGAGIAVDVRPTVALLAEIIPTLANGDELGIHRPAYSFGIQKKIWRHAFTLGLTTGPGTTVSQRAGTRAQFLGDPTADKPGGLFLGFDLTRQIR
jgi:mono/diheme cytochrome c family protein